METGNNEENRYGSIPTSRSLEQYAQHFGLSREGLLDWLASKHRVLDVGAGGGSMAREVAVLKLQGKFSAPTQIISLDIKYKDRNDIKKDNWFFGKTPTGQSLTRSQARQVSKSFRDSAIAATWNRLPFPDGTFDGVLASTSMGEYTSDEASFQQAFRELRRVMDPEKGDGFVTVGVDSENNLIGVEIGIDKPPTKLNMDAIADLHPILKTAEWYLKGAKWEKDYLQISTYDPDIKS